MQKNNKPSSTLYPDRVRIIVALDYDNATDAKRMADQLDPSQCHLKIGKELFTRCGPSIVKELQSEGHSIFLDLKFHDIPNTVAKAVQAAVELGVWMVNVHASGGRQMLKAAVQSVAESETLLTAVTVLTSMVNSDLKELGVTRTLEEQVLALTQLSKDCGVHGVVCSAKEVKQLRAVTGKEFILVTPGIRPAGSPAGDQQRITTPKQAFLDGSSYLVIGRPITQTKNPMKSLVKILQEISN